ncbi:hypothetical protein ACI0FR_02570 [Paenochrobactrum sp. BZR 201-1]
MHCIPIVLATTTTIMTAAGVPIVTTTIAKMFVVPEPTYFLSNNSTLTMNN